MLNLFQGLEDQLLALVVNKERPDLEETKTQLIIQNTEFTIKLKQLEEQLLTKLSNAEGDITEDVALIESLEESKRVATEITEKVRAVAASIGLQPPGLGFLRESKTYCMLYKEWPQRSC